MGTKILNKLKKKERNKPALIAVKLRRKAIYVMFFFLVPAVVVAAMIPLGIWVPGLAWLE